MTARETLDSIRAQLATGGDNGEAWSSLAALTDDDVIMHRVYDGDGFAIAECSNPDVAAFIAAAPLTVARLTAALEAVLKLTEGSEKHGSNLVFAVDIRRTIENALTP